MTANSRELLMSRAKQHDSNSRDDNTGSFKTNFMSFECLLVW